MSLFVCSECRVIENTATSHFWFREDQSTALCSQCDPEIGKWHGLFPREEDDGARQVAWRDGEWLR